MLPRSMRRTGFGIDFGTSNSAVARASEDGEVRIASWPIPGELARASGASSSDTTPTVLFAPSWDGPAEDEVRPARRAGTPALLIGHEAVSQYLFTGLDGRFIQSIKAFLPQSTFTHTIIYGRKYSIEDLIATFLGTFLRAAEAQLGGKIEGRVVLGRPARFSLDPEEDRLAEERLRRAARLAGLPDVAMVIEPVAAALAYEADLTADETVFVVDLGGGTSDFTLMRVGPQTRGRPDRRDSILASGGVPSAGDAIDGELVRARLFDPLGFGSSYLSMTARTPVPHWIWQKLKRWNHVSFLKSKKYLDFLREVHDTSDRPDEIAALIRIVDEDMGYLLFRAVERAKREVATSGRAWIRDLEHDLPVRRVLTRAQFVEATAEVVGQIRGAAEEVLAAAGIGPPEVDAVFMTGGTSLVPEVRAAFTGLFGEGKLRSRSTFTSVVDGLARAAAMFDL